MRYVVIPLGILIWVYCTIKTIIHIIRIRKENEDLSFPAFMWIGMNGFALLIAFIGFSIEYW